MKGGDNFGKHQKKIQKNLTLNPFFFKGGRRPPPPRYFIFLLAWPRYRSSFSEAGPLPSSSCTQDSPAGSSIFFFPHRPAGVFPSPAANRSLLSQPDFSPETGAISTQPLPLSAAHHLPHRSSPFPFFPQLLHQDKPILFIISFGRQQTQLTASDSLHHLLRRRLQLLHQAQRQPPLSSSPPISINAGSPRSQQQSRSPISSDPRLPLQPAGLSFLSRRTASSGSNQPSSAHRPAILGHATGHLN